MLVDTHVGMTRNVAAFNQTTSDYLLLFVSPLWTDDRLRSPVFILLLT